MNGQLIPIHPSVGCVVNPLAFFYNDEQTISLLIYWHNVNTNQVENIIPMSDK